MNKGIKYPHPHDACMMNALTCTSLTLPRMSPPISVTLAVTHIIGLRD